MGKNLFYLSTSTVLIISPHVHHDVPHGTEHPPWYSRYPPRYWTPPRYCTHVIQGERRSLKASRNKHNFYSMNTYAILIYEQNKWRPDHCQIVTRSLIMLWRHSYTRRYSRNKRFITNFSIISWMKIVEINILTNVQFEGISWQSATIH